MKPWNPRYSLAPNEFGEAIHILNTAIVCAERSIRNTLLILGARTAREMEKIKIHFQGQLGEYKYDLHFMVLEKLEAYVLPTRVSENLIFMGSLTEGETTIFNPHIGPEIMDINTMVSAIEAKIKVFG